MAGAIEARLTARDTIGEIIETRGYSNALGWATYVSLDAARLLMSCMDNKRRLSLPLSCH